jgi:DtxR family Mn-dependent transcriptional regulator
MDGVVKPETGQKISASLEDYLEAIFNLADESQGARSKDIAEALSVARSSVTGALQALREKGLANYRPYGCITLTESGQALAAEVVRKHNILKSFFVNVLGVDADVAQQAACKAEHALGPEIIGRLLSFIQYVTESHRNGHDVAEEFRQFHQRRSGSRARTVKS